MSLFILWKGPNSQDFVEPKVQGLWKAALNNNFSTEELSSLKVELLHYEARLLKLRHLNAEHALSSERYKVLNSYILIIGLLITYNF